jgi:hypothetical protein
MQSLINGMILFLLPCTTFANTPVNFHAEIAPILTRHGCNQGACHGSPTGKGGFRLSLRGYDPTLDEQSLLKEMGSRRIDRIQPEKSLLWLKATGLVSHEGGKKLDPASQQSLLMLNWIREGAILDPLQTIPTLRIDPAEFIISPDQLARPVNVFARIEGNPETEISHLVRWSVSDETVASIDDLGRVKAKSLGEIRIIAEYRSQVITSNVMILNNQSSQKWTAPESDHFIDRAVFSKLKQLQIQPSPISEDAEFFRRVHLDVIGRLPEPDTTRAFLLSKDPAKRTTLIDTLLNRPEFIDSWTQKWSDRLGINQRFVGKIGAHKYYAWVREQIAANTPEDQLARQILTASGGNYATPPAGFFRRLRDPESRAEEIAQLFMGVRMQCARCHNHPGEKWTQDDFYGLAAIFAQIKYRDGPFFIQIYDKEETVIDTRRGEIIHPRRNVVAPAKFPGESTILANEVDRRDAFVKWLTSPKNPYFARAAVNRIWFHLFGRGIVDPVDDMRITNPPSNEQLLDELAASFIRSGYDRKALIRAILNSKTYQLSSKPNSTHPQAIRFHAHYPTRRLLAEQLLDAISDVTQTAEKFPSLPAGTPASKLPDGEYKHPFLEAFGRPARAMVCECERDTDTNFSQALHLAAGLNYQSKLASPTGRISKLIDSKKSNSEIVEELFLATLGRFPVEKEMQFSMQFLGNIESRRNKLEDLLASLLNHPEFLFQH